MSFYVSEGMEAEGSAMTAQGFKRGATQEEEIWRAEKKAVTSASTKSLLKEEGDIGRMRRRSLCWPEAKEGLDALVHPLEVLKLVLHDAGPVVQGPLALQLGWA